MDLSELRPYEDRITSGVWGDIKHPVSGEIIGKVRVGWFDSMPAKLALHSAINNGVDRISAIREAVIEITRELQGITIDGIEVGADKEMIRRALTEFDSIYRQVVEISGDKDRFLGGE